MVNETTGGKPLFCDAGPFNANSQEKPKGGRVAFVGDPPLSYLMRVMAQTHTAIPTADLAELIAAAEECAGDLAVYVQSEYPTRDKHPDEQRRYERDMAPVRRLRAAVEKVRGK